MDSPKENISQRLKDVEALVEENNKMLHSLSRRAKFSTMFTILRWLIVIGVALGGFYFLNQYLQDLLALYRRIAESANVFDSSQESVQNAFDNFRNLFGGNNEGN